VAGYKKVFSFQLRLRYLLATAFVTALAFSSTVDAKAEESFCKYTNVKDYKNCIKNQSTNISPSYPITAGNAVGNEDAFLLWNECKNDNQSCPSVSKNYPIVQLKSNTGDNLIIGFDSNATWSWSKFKPKFSLTIPYINVIKWDKVNRFIRNNWSFELYKVYYLDENFKLKEFLFFAENKNNYSSSSNTYYRVISHSNYISKFLIDTTRLNKGENRADQVISILEKRLDILSNILSAKDENNETCIDLNNEKYPDLNLEYQRVENSIKKLKQMYNLKTKSNRNSFCTK